MFFLLKLSMTRGMAKGWNGFVWMLKILVPISFLTSLLAWSGWIYRLDFILEPVMGLIGLPAVAALPLFAGLLTGIYGAIAAMALLPMTVDQMTLVAIFLLISHNLIQESMIQSQSGLSFLKATTFRLIASIVTVMAASCFMDPESSVAVILATAPVPTHEPFLSMLNTWLLTTLVLSGKILAIIMTLMMVLEIMKSYHLIDRIVRMMSLVLKTLGLGKQSGFLWLTAAAFGLTYGAAVIVEEVKEGNLSKDELERLHLSIGINHAMIEDPALFLSLGLSPFWLWGPRLATAILAVQLLIITRRLIPFSKFFISRR
ncbi:MAG: iron transporter [Desulfobacteraceae bacterium]|nr:MAG: iron transporter [Desulfobacteraceae bacterium]